MRLRPTTTILWVLVLGLVLGVVKFIGEHPRRPAGFDKLQGLAAISKSDSWEKKWRLMSEQAVIDSWNRYGVSLDYSDGSIKSLDWELQRIAASPDFQKASEKDKRAEAIVMGAYVGEVIRRNHNGAWETDSNAVNDLSFPMVVRRGKNFPVAWCYKRLVNGDEDNVWDKYRFFVLGRTNGMDYTITHEANPAGRPQSNTVATN